MRAISSQYWKTSVLMLSFCFKLLTPCQIKIQNPIKHLRCNFRENSERFPSVKTPSQMFDWVLVGVYLLREFFFVKQPLRGVLQINGFEKFSLLHRTSDILKENICGKVRILHFSGISFVV